MEGEDAGSWVMREGNTGIEGEMQGQTRFRQVCLQLSLNGVTIFKKGLALGVWVSSRFNYTTKMEFCLQRFFHAREER